MKKFYPKIIAIIVSGSICFSMANPAIGAMAQGSSSDFTAGVGIMASTEINPASVESDSIEFRSFDMGSHSINDMAALGALPKVDKAWDVIYGSTLEEAFTSVIQTPDGSFIAGGYAASADSGEISAVSKGGTDGLLVKTNESGAKIWDLRIGGSGNDYFTTLINTSDGGFLAAGFTESLPGGDLNDQAMGGQDGLIVKFDANGNKLWDQIFGGSGMDRFYSVIEMENGTIAAAGESNSPISGEITENNNGGSDGLLVQLNSEGRVLWHQLFGGHGLDFFTSVIETGDGLAAAGGSYSSLTGSISEINHGSQDGLLVRFSAAGIPLWHQLFGGRAYDRFDALVHTPDGGFIAAGTTSSPRSGDISQSNLGRTDGLLVKFDDLGKPVWHQLIGGPGSDSFTGLIRSGEGHYTAVGSAGSGYQPAGGSVAEEGYGLNDALLYQFDGNGGYIWDHLTGGVGEDRFHAVLQTADGGFISAGSTDSSASGNLTDGTCGESDGLMVRHYVPALPVITKDPSDLTATIGGNAVFRAEYAGKPAPLVQWQVRQSGSDSWSNLSDAVSNSLSFITRAEDQGNTYRIIAANQWGSAVSQEASLTLQEEPVLEVIAGSSRLGTAVEVSQAAYVESEFAVLVQSDNFPDALSASTLAYALKAPVLLSKPDRLSEVTQAELKRLNVKKVFILGGSKAIGESVENALIKDLGLSVERVYGTNRYHTAVKVAELLESLQGPKNSVVLASGEDFADALSSGSYAARQNMPVMLTRRDDLSDILKSYLFNHQIQQIVLIGGESAVSEKVEDQLNQMGIDVTRIAGATRFGTSALIAEKFFPHSTRAIAVNGWDFPDALTSAPYGAWLNAPLLLVNNEKVHSEINNYLKTSPVTNVKVIGGDAAVNSAARETLLNILTSH